MLIAVSPYHLTTREPAATTALLLASRVVTMLPSPFGGPEREHVEDLTARIPRYLDFMQSWSWTIPLWNAGVVSSRLGNEDAVEDVRSVCARIAGESRFLPLRPLMKSGLFETEEAYLNAVARDLLKAGPDPAITVPVAAGMDRFAVRNGLIVARSEASSVVQRAEERLGRRAFAVAVPVLLQAGGQRLLDARGTLEPELEELRAAMGAFADRGEEMTEDESAQAQADLAIAARGYAAAFAEAREGLLAPDDEDDLRIIEGTVAITGLVLPADAVLTSSMAAMRALVGQGSRVPEGTGSAPNLPVRFDALEGREFLSILIRPLGRPAPGRR